MKRELSNRALTICGVPVWERGQNLFLYTGPEFLGKRKKKCWRGSKYGKILCCFNFQLQEPRKHYILIEMEGNALREQEHLNMSQPKVTT